MLLRWRDCLQDDDITSDIIPDYSKSEEDVCCTGMVDIVTNANEISIRSAIQEVLVNRVPDIHTWDFDFVKVKGKKVTTPVFKKGQDVGYKQLKALAGQGAIYVRLKNNEVLNKTDALDSKEVVVIADNNNVPDPVGSDTPNTDKSSTVLPSCSHSSVISTPSQQSQSSCNMVTFELAHLKQIFPQHNESYLEDVLTESCSIDDAISSVLSSQENTGTKSDRPYNI